MKLEKLDTKTKIDCGNFLMPSMATEFKEKLTEALEAKQPIEVSLENIDGIDSLNFQLLVCCKKQCHEESLPFIVKSYSENFEEHAKSIGLFEYLLEGE